MTILAFDATACARALCMTLALTSVTTASAHSSAAPANAETAATAREMAHRAMDRMKERRWEEARRLLAESYRLVPAPSIAVLEGEALMQLDRFVEAQTRFDRVVNAKLDPDAPAAYRDAQTIARTRLEELEKRTPRLLVHVSGVDDPSGVELSVDGVRIDRSALGAERRVNPGAHVVSASHAGVSRTERIVLREGQRQTVALSFDGSETTPTEADSGGRNETGSSNWLAWTALGVGAAGLTTGIVGGLVMQDKKDFLDSRCNPGCPQSLRDEVASFERARTVSYVGYGTAIVGTAAGATLFLLGSREPEAEVEPWVTSSWVGVRGRF